MNQVEVASGFDFLQVFTLLFRLKPYDLFSLLKKVKLILLFISIITMQFYGFCQEPEFKQTLWTAMWSPDGKLIATGGSAGQLKILDAVSLEVIKSYSVGNVILSRVKWHPTQNKLAVITQSDTFKAKILI